MISFLLQTLGFVFSSFSSLLGVKLGCLGLFFFLEKTCIIIHFPLAEGPNMSQSWCLTADCQEWGQGGGSMAGANLLVGVLGPPMAGCMAVVFLGLVSVHGRVFIGLFFISAEKHFVYNH